MKALFLCQAANNFFAQFKKLITVNKAVFF
jgi:hypothetical protein